jgi:succinate--hydroxymethylglutarate CoA-transferase
MFDDYLHFLAFFTITMPRSIASKSLLLASTQVLRPNGFRSVLCGARCRKFADIANDMTLPLKGIKVLDMTRVLAGVCSLSFAI